MSKDHILFVFVTLLIAIQVADGTIQTGGSLVFMYAVFVLPLIIVAVLWHRMKGILRLSMAIIFFVLEMNYAANETFPAFIHEGVTKLTRNGLFLLVALLILIAVIGMLSVRVYKETR